MKKIIRSYILLIAIAAISIIFIIPTFKNINFGLDLQGGFEVLYQVDSIDSKEVTSSMITNTYKTIEKRTNTLGVSEPNITIEGDKIRVQLAGVTNPEDARKLLSKAANLTFRDTEDNLLMTSSVIGGAKVSSDQYGKPAVALTVKDIDKFYEVTKSISQKADGKNMIVIWLDFDEAKDSYSRSIYSCGSDNSNCLSAASVREAFASDVIIQGNFTQTEVETLVDLINSGSLQTKLTEISSKTVDASFGVDALNKTLFAGIIGITLIIIVLICLYHTCGVVASVTILAYTFITLLTFWLVGGVLTLPGIAALVIGIGMAVDSSVIAFARIKDELYEGRSLKTAFTNGIKTSFGTILDSNLTTLIVAIILFIFGESSIKGFATMLIISIIITMLIMVLLNRLLLSMLVKTKYFEDKLNLFIRIKESDIPCIKKNEKRKKYFFTKIDFVKPTKKILITLIIILIGGSVLLGFKGLHLGIDFKGGSSITLKTDKEITKENVTEDIKSLQYKMYGYEEINGSTIIKLEETLNEEQVLSVSKYFKDKYEATTDIGVVSNIVKKELIKNAIISLLLASIGIIIYVSIRFKFSYAISGLAALFHDVFIIFVIFSLFKLEVSTIFIAAILSIVGYSINDTIVTFDRIRETIKNKYKGEIKNKEDLKDIVNVGLRETLGRSIITTITTMLPVICLILFGSHEISNFNIALLIGLIAGSLSSIFFASQLWMLIESKNIGKVKKKWLDDDEVEELKIKGINS